MRLHRTYQPLWLLPVVLAGCSSTVGSRFGGTPQSRSIAVVGERPLPAATGEPGGRVVADNEEPEPRLNSKRRISGKVVDEAGDPVVGATVRLADSGAKGGKEIQGTTDHSGAFTLNGLRPGSTYVLIAEGDDEHGSLHGRVEAKTAETGVEIALVSDDKKTTTRKSARPAKAKAVSNREDLDEGPDLDDGPKVNREDIAPPANEAEPLDPGPPEPTRAGRPQLSPPDPGVGWKNSRNATASRSQDADTEGESASADRPAPRRRKVVKAPAPAKDAGPSDDEPNPLPPALDPDGSDDPGPARPSSARSNSAGKVGAKTTRTPPEAGEIALAPEASLDEKADRARSLSNDAPDPSLASGELRSPSSLMPDADQAPTIPKPSGEVARAIATEEGTKLVASSLTEPPALPPIGKTSVQVAAHEAPSPTPSPPDPKTATQDVSPSNPASEPVFASKDQGAKPVEMPAPPADYNPFANLSASPLPIDKVVENRPVVRPTAAEAPAQAEAVEEPPKKKWGELAATVRPPVVVAPPSKVTLTGALLRRIRPPAEAKDASIAACTYDPTHRKLTDFRLPDMEGRPVRFQDFGADYVLLDFWGTWCAPCLDSIPHLVELQKRYGPSKLKVVGIACEEAAPELRKAKVDEVARKLGINYPVLLSTMDGKPCPVQQALKIQAMPTMILLDRKGEVLWRSTGATPASESRLDKVLALTLSRGDSARR